MTNEEMNVAIAEWRGWKWCKVLNSEFGDRWSLQNEYFRSGVLSPNAPFAVQYIVKDKLTDEDKRDHQLVYLGPKFSTDLNAMSVARKALPTELRPTYQHHLDLICADLKDPHCSCWDFIDASADQHAEALLKTIGKWTE